MHESSLARQVLAAVLDRARREGATRIRAIRGWIAETEALSPESVRFHFDLLAKGTPAEGAELTLTLLHVSARCGACGSVYAPDHHVLLCPACSSTDGELLGQTGLGIDAMDVES
jgi:hydrogenase nickel incorporation protein HypA/HybF